MDRSLRQAVEQLIGEVTGQPAVIEQAQAVGGGCISQACVVGFRDGRSCFVKSNQDSLPGLFESEARGLAVLRQAGVVRVPRVWGVRPADGAMPSLIVTEAIGPGQPGRGFSQRFGRQLAQLHQATQQDRFGFDADNYLGSTRQPNPWTDDWCSFWRQHRLGYMLALARQKGVSDRALDQGGARLMDRLDQFIGQPVERACLLHGDLWGGNYLVDESGGPVLIDPAVYHGRREADLAMTLLFGGFDEDFYAGYNEVWPLAPGFEHRLAVYKLYHLLNHLVLFGRGYHSQCMAVLKELE